MDPVIGSSKDREYCLKKTTTLIILIMLFKGNFYTMAFSRLYGSNERFWE